MESGKDQHGLLDALDAYLVYCANVGVYAEIHWYLTKILSLLPATGGGYLRQFVRDQIDDHMAVKNTKGNTEQRQCFLTKLVEMRKASPQTFTHQDVFDACITNIGAGSDTTSISLTAILYHLMINPDKLQIVRHERLSCFRHSALTDVTATP